MLRAQALEVEMDERRTSERHDIELSVEIARGESKVTAQTEDLSIGGMRLKMPDDAEPFRSGEKVTLTFHLPDLSAPIEVPAEVRWIDRIFGTRAGLQFTKGLRAAHVWAIDRVRKVG